MPDDTKPPPEGCDVRWPYRADPPQRLKRQDGTFELYLQSGGLARPHEDVRGFLAAEPGNAGDMARKLGRTLFVLDTFEGFAAADLAAAAYNLVRVPKLLGAAA